jgi:hypothetical protein
LTWAWKISLGQKVHDYNPVFITCIARMCTESQAVSVVGGSSRPVGEAAFISVTTYQYLIKLN